MTAGHSVTPSHLSHVTLSHIPLRNGVPQERYVCPTVTFAGEGLVERYGGPGRTNFRSPRDCGGAGVAVAELFPRKPTGVFLIYRACDLLLGWEGIASQSLYPCGIESLRQSCGSRGLRLPPTSPRYRGGLGRYRGGRCVRRLVW